VNLLRQINRYFGNRKELMLAKPEDRNRTTAKPEKSDH